MRYVLIAVLLALTGCSGQAEEPEPATVGLQTTCDLVFLEGVTADAENGWWSRSVALISARAGSIDEDEAAKVSAELDDAASSAKPVLQPHLEVMADASADPKVADLDVDAYELAAREVANQCTPYVALD